MSTDCKGLSQHDLTPSFIEEDYDSDLGSRSTSSTLSWTDETEKDAASKLKEHFERFEAALYSETNGEDLTDTERAECNIWKEHFPHLRVVGKRIIPIPIDPNENYEPEFYPADYEEVLACHSDNHEPPNTKKISIPREKCLQLIDKSHTKEELKDAVVDKLCERVLPSVIKKIEELSAEKLINTLAKNESIRIELKKDLEINGTSYPDKKTPSSTNFRNSYLKVDDLKQLTSQKLNQLGKKFPTITINDSASSTKSSKTKLKSVPQSSARITKKKSIPNEYETETPVENICVTPKKSNRHGILPPLEALAITPKLPSKRATSAMLRFARTQPRVRPFTTRNKTMFLLPVKNGFSGVSTKAQSGLINPLIEEKNNYASSLPPYSGRIYNRRCKLPPRWRY
ncbi:uncharacterized protein LOC106663973 isoform X2 [Cimex lectularius]|uniref:DUF3719 domain-containing protein n=1 Tax=Cimex lectularius TaxID=79782 RepID=A0A8I6TET1_CIMLE|nr:uncharacterized protein LOC106663973 isoform X2 [Cimex lectularius]